MDKDEMLKHVLHRFGLATTYTDAWHNNILKWRKLYDFEHYEKKTDPLPGETQFADPTYTNTVDLAVGIFQGNSMRWKSVGFNPSSKEAKDTSMVEKYISAVVDMNSERREYDIIYETNLQFTRDGGSVLYTMWDPDIANDSLDMMSSADADGQPIESDIFMEPPIHMEVIDPMQIYLLPGGPGRWLCVMRAVNMSLYEAEILTCKELEQCKGMTIESRMETNVDFIDYWEITERSNANFKYNEEDYEEAEILEENEDNRKWYIQRAIVVGEELVTPLHVMKGYYDFPYTIGFYKPTNRQSSAGWHSVLTPLQPVVSLLEKSINRRTRLIDVLSNLPIIARTEKGTGVTIDRSVSTVVNMKLNEELLFPSMPGTAPDVDKQIAFLQSRIQQSGFPEVMYGAGSDVESGYALSQLSDQGRIRLNQPINHIAKFWSWVARKVIDITVENAKDRNIFVYGTLNKAPFTDVVEVNKLTGYKIDCVIKPEFPNERTRNHAMASQVKGIVSDYTLRETYLGFDQSSDEDIRLQTEAALKHPIMQQFLLLEKLMQIAEVEKNPAAAKAVEVMLSQMQASMGGATEGSTQSPEDPNAAGLTGTQGQDGLPPMQARTGVPAGSSADDQQKKMATNAPKLNGGN